STLRLHVPPVSSGCATGSICPPENEIAPDPGVAVTDPPQSLKAPFGEATTKPAGSESVKETLVSVTSESGGFEFEFGFVIVNDTVVKPPGETVSGANTVLIVGGKATASVALAPEPLPPSFELTGPVSLR